jgi:hypothetical protein
MTMLGQAKEDAKIGTQIRGRILLKPLQLSFRVGGHCQIKMFTRERFKITN